jgi:tetratricopeptide (TPR) repeat protein
VCEGAHVIEVRGPTGRFVDRREWRAGGSETLEATLRSAFPIVAVSGPGAEAVLNQLKSDVARVLGPAAGVLIYEPVADELQAAMQAENIPAGWLDGAVTRSETALPRDALRDFGRRLAARLGVQGFAAVVAGAERFQVSLGLQALGSGEPEVLSFSTADQASQRVVLDRLAQPLPPITRLSLESSAIDVAGLAGAVVVRAGGVGEAAGLAVGDVITGVNGTTVASVGEFRAAIGTMDEAAAVTLDVTGPGGTARQVSVTPALAAEVLPLRDSSLLYNLALLSLQELTQTASSPAERSAAHVNLAIVLLRLGSWDEALQSLGQARLGDGPGVSAGTVAYLRGLALDGAGRVVEAQAAFKEAASAPQARLGSQGPLVSPLARLRLSGGS